MISLQTGIKRKDKINSIVGYSGRIIDTEHLSKNIVSRPNIILMHGDVDQVVPIEGLLEAKDFFGQKIIIKLKQKYLKIVNIVYLQRVKFRPTIY